MGSRIKYKYLYETYLPCHSLYCTVRSSVVILLRKFFLKKVHQTVQHVR